ncbi:MAG: exodeoxyribonuclease III [Deltaproteobacteria bacterium]|nr:exodeoxyribonuclease III [Deltaproteobacteria bacterium]
MKIATWNVNGIRARSAQVAEWLERDRPDVVCLQELKATVAQVPVTLAGRQDYWCRWHGAGPYSGVALLLRKERFPDAPEFGHPDFDFETRVVTAAAGELTLASIYVPNGGKDYAAKLKFLGDLDRWVAAAHDRGARLVLCGDVNVTRTDLDVHPKERRPDAIGQKPDERELLEGVLGRGLVDVGRTLDPENPSLFTWWPPWRQMRQRNIGWRIDYVLASADVAAGARASRVQADYGTSDHAPVVATFA